MIRTRLLSNIERLKNQRFLTICRDNGDEFFSWNDLAARIADYLDFYRSQNLKKGDLVLIILQEGLDLFAAFLAASLDGYLPAYFAYPSPKQSANRFSESVEVLDRSNSIRLFLTYRPMEEILSGYKLQNSSGVIATTDQVRRVHSAESAMAMLQALSADESFLQFSSGTTAAKKGVRISAQALIHQIEAYNRVVQLTDGDTIVSWLPHYHDMGLIACMLMPLVLGFPMVMTSPFRWVRNPKILLEMIARYQGTHVWLPCFALGHLSNSIRDHEIGEYSANSLKRLVLCSEPVLKETVEAFEKKFAPIGFTHDKIYNCYAMAENTFAMTSTRGPLNFAQARGGRWVASVGNPLNNIEIVVKNPNGRSLADGAEGELWIKSDCMLSEYHANPEATKAAFSEGFFKTGDLGFRKGDEFFVTGRAKEIMIIAGENVYPQDIELIVNADANFTPGRNVTFSVTDKRNGTERVVVLAETEKKLDEVDPGRVIANVFNLLNISVSEFHVLPPMTLLKGTAGKVSRSMNKERFLNGGFASFQNKAVSEGTKDSGGQNPLEAAILRLLARRSSHRIDPRSSLFESGVLDSLSFAMFVVDLENRFEVRIPSEFVHPEKFGSVEQIQDVLQKLPLKNLDHFDDSSIPERFERPTWLGLFAKMIGMKKATGAKEWKT